MMCLHTTVITRIPRCSSDILDTNVLAFCAFKPQQRENCDAAIHFRRVGQNRRIQRPHQNAPGRKRGSSSNAMCICLFDMYVLYLCTLIYLCNLFLKSRALQKNTKASSKYSRMSILHHTATHCNTLQHTATLHRNTRG